jgi:hypothetical protein
VLVVVVLVAGAGSFTVVQELSNATVNGMIRRLDSFFMI